MADWTRVQGGLNTTGASTTNAVTLGATVGNGNAILGAVLTDKNIQITEIADDQGNKLSTGQYRVTPTFNDTSTLAATGYRAVGPIKNAPKTITVTLSASSTTIWHLVAEFSPPTGATAFCLDGLQGLAGQAVTTFPNFQTLNNDVLVWAVSFSSSATQTAGAGFTVGQGQSTQQLEEWKIQATASNAVTAGFATQAGSTWAVVFGLAPVAQTRWEPIQSVLNRAGTGTTATTSFARPVQPGNIVVGAIASDASQLVNLTTFVDDQGNHPVLIPGTLNVGQASSRQTWWSGGQLSNGPKTWTTTYSVSQTVNFLQMTEFAPPPGTVSVQLDPASGANTNDSNTTSTSTTTPNITTTKNGDLLYGWGDNGGGADAPANGWSATNGPGMTWMSAYFIQPTAGAVSFTCNHAASTGSTNDVSIAAFSAAPGGGQTMWTSQQGYMMRFL